MVKRRALALAVVGCTLAVLAGTAQATEESPAGEQPAAGEEQQSVEDIGTGSEISQQFRPPEYESPGFFRFMLYPLLGVGVVATLGLLLIYLVWQPRFAAERGRKRRR